MKKMMAVILAGKLDWIMIAGLVAVYGFIFATSVNLLGIQALRGWDVLMPVFLFGAAVAVVAIKLLLIIRRMALDDPRNGTKILIILVLFFFGFFVANFAAKFVGA